MKFSSSLNTLERPGTVKDTVSRALRQAILSGGVDPNDVLTEAVLAAKFGVSRTPVREALQDLEREGLLEPAGIRGKRVRRIRPHEVRELFWLRRTLEGGIVAQLASSKQSSQDLQRLRKHLDNQRRALKYGDKARFLAEDSSFHCEMAALTGFPRVTDIIRNLRELFQLVGIKAISEPRRLETVLAEHEAILSAIEQQDPEGARNSLALHLSNTETLALCHLYQTEAPDAEG